MAVETFKSKSFLDEIGKDFLSCSICLEIYKNPKILPCLHTFCQQCLLTIKAQSGGVLKCATCRIQCNTPIQDLKSNFFVISLLDKFHKKQRLKPDVPLICETCQVNTATHSCIDCPQFCCDVCVDAHYRIPALRLHKVLTIDQYRESHPWSHLSKVFCRDHTDSQLKFYCDSCQVPICTDCTILKHRVPEHIHRDLQEVGDEYKHELKQMLRQLKEQEAKFNSKRAMAKTTRDEIRNQCEAEKAKVKRRAKEMIERIKKEEKMLIDALDENAAMGLKSVGEMIDEMEFHHGNIVSTHHYLDTLVHHGNAVHLLSTRTESKNRIMQLVAMETKPLISHDIIEFQPGSDRAAHVLVGVIKAVCTTKGMRENIPTQCPNGDSVNLLITARESRGKQIISKKDARVTFRSPDASWENDIPDKNNRTCSGGIHRTGKMHIKHQVAMTFGNQQKPGSTFQIPVIRGLVQTIQDGKFRDPYGLTINKHGDFVTADRGRNQVITHDRNGKHIQSFTFTGQFAKPFKPCDVAISDGSKYFILDDNNKQVVVSNENRKLIRAFGSSELDFPHGIAINPVTKNVYVTEYILGCVRKYKQDGCYINAFGRKGDQPGEFNAPYLLAINKKGMVYVADNINGRIQVFNSDDQFMFEFSSTGDGIMTRPRGVAIDKNDYVYVSSNHRVTKYDSYGQFICRIDSDMDSLSYPRGIAVTDDVRCKISVVDNGNKSIKVFVE
ncbi:E3 ubiquitin-protein ligase TRIM56-like [Saccoglossus kowalevskii]